MFDKIIKNWRGKNELMNKVLEKLNDSSKWTYDRKSIYEHIDSELIITWGWDSDYFSRKISFPIDIDIPFLYREKFEKCLQQIASKNKTDNDSDFLMQYLNGEYIQKIKVSYTDKSERSLWLSEQKIYDWYMSSTWKTTSYFIWFKHEEDIMAYKLRWDE